MMLEAYDRPPAVQIPPEDLSAVGILRAGASPEWAAEVVIRLAEVTSGIRTHTVLCNLDAAPAHLDRELDAERLPGFTGAIRGKKRIVDIAVSENDRDFIYLPAGEAPAPASELLATEAMRLFVDQIRRLNGTILLYIPLEEASRERERLEKMLDAQIVLGHVTPGQPGLNVPLIAHLEPEAEKTDQPKPRRTPLAPVEKVLVPRQTEPYRTSGKWGRLRDRLLHPYDA